MFRSFLFLVGTLSALCLVLGYGGRFHGAGDTLALARPIAVPVLAVISLGWMFFKPRLVGVAGVALSGLSVSSQVPPGPASFVPDGAPLYSVYQKNLLFLLPNTRPVADDILLSGGFCDASGVASAQPTNSEPVA